MPTTRLFPVIIQFINVTLSLKNCLKLLFYYNTLTGIVGLDFASPNNTCLSFNNSSCWAQGNHQLYNIYSDKTRRLPVDKIKSYQSL